MPNFKRIVTLNSEYEVSYLLYLMQLFLFLVVK
jgi:hypothetical protein